MVKAVSHVSMEATTQVTAMPRFVFLVQNVIKVGMWNLYLKQRSSGGIIFSCKLGDLNSISSGSSASWFYDYDLCSEKKMKNCTMHATKQGNAIVVNSHLKDVETS